MTLQINGFVTPEYLTIRKRRGLRFQIPTLRLFRSVPNDGALASLPRVNQAFETSSNSRHSLRSCFQRELAASAYKTLYPSPGKGERTKFEYEPDLEGARSLREIKQRKINVGPEVRTMWGRIRPRGFGVDNSFSSSKPASRHKILGLRPNFLGTEGMAYTKMPAGMDS
ncbi:hypothetical protein Lal_00039606 [Lupinus albus]|nr:hypothetical protein Lal_00039606 [Lupinus albus]